MVPPFAVAVMLPVPVAIVARLTISSKACVSTPRPVNVIVSAELLVVRDPWLVILRPAVIDRPLLTVIGALTVAVEPEPPLMVTEPVVLIVAPLKIAASFPASSSTFPDAVVTVPPSELVWIEAPIPFPVEKTIWPDAVVKLPRFWMLPLSPVASVIDPVDVCKIPVGSLMILIIGVAPPV